jgi:hypothetical protein
MNKTPMMFLALAALVAAPACSKKDDGAASSAAAAKAAAPSATPTAAPAAATASGGAIAQLKLAYDGPSGDVSDMSMGGDPEWMVQTSEGLVFSVQAPKTAPTLDSAVDDAGMYSPTISKKDKTADGYDLEYSNTGSMGANYFVEILRTINGKPYVCKTTTDTADHAAAVVKVCQSLKAQ